MSRSLTEPEQQARKKRDGLTAREHRAKHSKFKNPSTKHDVGNFEVAVLFYGNDMPQTAPFNNRLAALARFETLSKNPNVSVVKLIQYITGATETKKNVLLQLNKTNQRFINSKKELIWRVPGSTNLLTDKAIKQSPKLLEAQMHNGLELARVIFYDGNPWWEKRA